MKASTILPFRTLNALTMLEDSFDPIDIFTAMKRLSQLLSTLEKKNEIVLGDGDVLCLELGEELRRGTENINY